MKNTVNLSIENYNEMRDFNKAIKEGGGVGIFFGWDGYKNNFFTKDEAVKKIAEANVKLQIKIDELKNPEVKKPSFEELRKMSWWQFRKWKRGL